MAESKSTDWRQLCAAAAREQDAAKLSCLVNQLIVALDETLARSDPPYAPGIRVSSLNRDQPDPATA